MTTPKDRFRDDLTDLLREHHQFTRNHDLVDVLEQIAWAIDMGSFDWDDDEGQFGVGA